MKIHFERTGGFMGLRMVAAIDTDDLPEEEAATLHELLDKVDFFELPARLDSPDPAMDQFHYVLSVSREEPSPPGEVHTFWNRVDDEEEDEDESSAAHGFGDRALRDRDSRTSGADLDTDSAGAAHTVSFTDAAAPLEMLPLIRMLTRMAHGE